MTLSHPSPTPCSFRTGLSNTLILQAALVGRMVTLMSFSGKLDDMLSIVDHLEQPNMLHTL